MDVTRPAPAVAVALPLVKSVVGPGGLVTSAGTLVVICQVAMLIPQRFVPVVVVDAVRLALAVRPVSTELIFRGLVVFV